MIQSEFGDFLAQREAPLWERFRGIYRAEIVETNDPLNMHRVRVKCPDIHDWDLQPERCPWAQVAGTVGGKRAGSWASYCIGDQVWINFERGHPYNIVVVGSADPTRRQAYPLQSVYGRTPLPVDKNGDPGKAPQDFNLPYLPADGRPMSQGVVDRYGNADFSSSVGFFPKQHKKNPPGSDYDAVQHSQFKQQNAKPEVNKPDTKCMARVSKYGHIFVLGDQGYSWLKTKESGEFEGDDEKDAEFEIARWKYLQRLINEDAPSGHDQRRIMMMTRYGHKFEMRDVGWAQKGPIESKTREGEYGKAARISDEEGLDQRWVKIRTKGGMLFQMNDAGFHPQNDEFVKRQLVDEIGDKADGEAEWKDKDARWIRVMSRWGSKIVLDDRGSSRTAAETDIKLKGNGILMKGRRPPGSQGESGSGSPRGHYVELNEKDSVNQVTLGSALGSVVQLSDKQQYVMLATRRDNYPEDWQGLKENEFLREPFVANGAPGKTHHLILDLHNEYLSLKTRAGQGDGPDGSLVNPTGLSSGAINQGLEARDGSMDDGPWVELVDGNGRNLWFWGKDKKIICHAATLPEPIQLMWWMDEINKNIVVRHNESSGRIQIYSRQPIEIVSNKTIHVHSKSTLALRGDERITLTGGSTNIEVGQNGVLVDAKVAAPSMDAFFCGVMAGPGAGCPQSPTIVPPAAPDIISAPQLSPTDRGKRYNTSLDQAAPRSDFEPELKG